MKSKKQKKNIFKGLFFLLTLASFALKIARFLFGKKKIKDINNNLKDFEKEEIDELLKLAKGKVDKERYWHDSLGIFQDYFIPNQKNNHKPKILHTKSLVSIAFVLGFLKLLLLSYVFLISPFEAFMSEMITNKVFELINKERAAENIENLELNPALSASALKKANDMIERGYFSHFTPDGKKPWDFIDRNEYPYIFVGENLAMNFTSADSVHIALMDSPTHKKNIMNSRYNEIGLAIVSGVIDGKETNVLVQMFASRNQVKIVKAETEIVKNISIEEKESGIVSEKQSVNTNAKEVSKKIETAEVNATQAQVASLSQQFSSDRIEKQEPELIEDFSDYNNAEVIDSPNRKLENNSENLINVPNTDMPRITFVSSIVEQVNKIFFGALIVMIMVLSLNILVRIRVQHKPVIVQTLILMFFIAGLAYWHIDLEAGMISEIFLI